MDYQQRARKAILEICKVAEDRQRPSFKIGREYRFIWNALLARIVVRFNRSASVRKR